MSVNENWRKPLLDVYTEETSLAVSNNPEDRGLKHIVSGPDRFDNVGRLLEGCACSNCLTPFPARPGLDTVHMFKQGQMNYIGLRSEEEALALVAKCCCPICGWEQSLEMRDVMFMGRQNYDGSTTK